MADFARAVVNYFTSRNQSVPKVQGRYSIQSTRVDKRDVEAFMQLFYERPSTQVGNGEVALFWLFGGMEGNVKSTGSGFAADLQIGNANIEVKAYNSDNVKIGRFQRQTEFLQLVNTLFSVYNLVNDKNEVFSVFSFNYESLTRAAEEFCLIRQSLNEILNKLDTIERNTFMKIKIFKGILERAKSFDEFAKKLGINEICFIPGQGRPGGELIAATLLKFVTEATLLEKPGGSTGYMAIMPERFNETSQIEFIKVIENGRINLSESKILNIHEYVSFSSGAMFINFKKLFGSY